jgi:hypothetical protein
MSDKTGAVLFMSAEDASLGKHGNYGDDSGSHYAWDTTVPNFSIPKVGDLVLIRSRHRVIGVSLITDLTTEPSFKLRARCGKCNSTKLKWSRPRSAFRCSCGEYSSTPNTEYVGNLTSYEANYDVFFTPLPEWDVEMARGLSTTPKSIHSIQKVDARSLLDSVPIQISNKLGFRKIASEFVRVERQAISRTNHEILPAADVCEITGISAPMNMSVSEFAIYNFHLAQFESRGVASVLDVIAIALYKGQAKVSSSGKTLLVPISSPDGPITYEYPINAANSMVQQWLSEYSKTR